MSDNQPTNIVEASAAATSLQPARNVTLSDGSVCEVGRLSWIRFEAVWTDLAGMLNALAQVDAEAGTDELLAALAGTPAALAKLAALSTDRTETELAGLPFDDVLAISAAAINLNFVDSAGVRSFFFALGGLADVLE